MTDVHPLYSPTQAVGSSEGVGPRREKISCERHGMTATEFDASVHAMAAGAVAFRQRDFAEAAVRFREAATAGPADARAWLCLARAEWLAGRLPEARRACEEAGRRDPKNWRAALFGAHLAAKADDARARVGLLKTVTALRPDAVVLRLQLIAALQRRLQHQPALAVAEEAVVLAPADPAVRLASARCHLALNRLAEAEAEIEASGIGGSFEADRVELLAALAARRARIRGQAASKPSGDAESGLDGASPVIPAAAVPSSASTETSAAPADVETLVTAAMLRDIERGRRRPSITDHLLILRALVLRDLRAHYRNSFVGAAVELVRPAVVVVVHTWLFYWLKKPMPGQIPVPIYVLAGFSTWFAFQSCWSGASTGSKWPAGATAWPGISDLHLRLAKAGWGLMLNLAFCLLALLPLALLKINLALPDVPETCLIFAMAGGGGFGLGLLLEGLGRRLAFVKTAEKLLTWALFITSGLYFSLATTPSLVANWYWYNPLLHLVENQRHAFDPGYPVALLDLRYPAVVAILLLVFGLLVHRSAGWPDQD